MNFKYIFFIGFVLFNGINSMNPLKEEIKAPVIEERKTPTVEDLENTLTHLKAEEYWVTENRGFRSGKYFGIDQESKNILAAAKTDSFLKIKEDSIETNLNLQNALKLFYSYKQSANHYAQECPYKKSGEETVECRELYRNIERIREETKLSYFQLMTDNKNSNRETNTSTH